MQGGSFTTYNSHFMLLATGGIGRVYSFTTNSKIATGDGIAFAYENGAEIRNLHLIQFHPTAFNDHHTRECFLISEAVRGEGAYLLNCKKERFMDRYDERLELAPVTWYPALSFWRAGKPSPTTSIWTFPTRIRSSSATGSP